MNKEIKIIDLLNMIAEGKEVPMFKFKKRNSIWKYNPLYFQFQSESSSLCLDIMPVLNESVELIEEDNNKIEKDLHPYGSCSDEDLYYGLVNKLYKVIDYINEKWGMYE